MPTSLECSKCKAIKPLIDFPKRNNLIGYRKTCRPCRNKVHSEWRNKPENIYRARLSRMNHYYRYRLKSIKEARQRSLANPEWAIKAKINYRNKRPYYDALRNTQKQLNKESVKEIEKILVTMEKKCFYCGIQETDIAMKESNYFPVHRLQIDKMIPVLGYTPTNVVLACPICNLIKNRWFSPDTMKIIAQEYVTKIWELKHDQLL